MSRGERKFLSQFEATESGHQAHLHTQTCSCAYVLTIIEILETQLYLRWFSAHTGNKGNIGPYVPSAGTKFRVAPNQRVPSAQTMGTLIMGAFRFWLTKDILVICGSYKPL